MSKWYTVVFVYVALVGCNQAAQETSDGASADTGGALDVRMMDGAANDGSVSEAGAVDVPQRADAQPGRADAPPTAHMSTAVRPTSCGTSPMLQRRRGIPGCGKM